MSTEHDFRARRKRLIETHPDGPIVVRGASGSGRPNPNFFYLTGLDEPRGMLLLSAAGTRIETGARYPGADYVCGRLARQLLFLPAGNALARRWGEEGAATAETYSSDAAGVDAVLPIAEIEPTLDRGLSAVERLYYVRRGSASLGGPPDDDARFVARVRERFFGLDIRDATRTVERARTVKDDPELQRIERAVALTEQALARAVDLIRPGVAEREIAAEIARTYALAGASHAFDPIVGSGKNSLALHYRSNSDRLEAGRLVLIDTGASVEGYKSDVTRTYPVDGRFTDRQREVYATVLHAQAEAISGCGPGARLADIHAIAYRVIDDAGFGAGFVHGTSHHLGLETHDAGDVHQPLEVGAVVTIEPGIYLPDETIGVRIEDDVLVTADGPRVLSETISSSPDAIEASLR